MKVGNILLCKKTVTYRGDICFEIGKYYTVGIVDKPTNIFIYMIENESGLWFGKPYINIMKKFKNKK